ncbi:MAG: HEAT repeat domain-containing protein [Candidatus Diapherotrites archaeon]|nr:HEAT repeat domain-containing protein [Candidatus Diapherotrites archaeon]
MESVRQGFTIGSKKQTLASLREFGESKNPFALPVIRVFLHHPDPTVRLSAANWLMRFNLKSEIPFIKRLEKDSDELVRETAKKCVRNLKRSGK